MRALVAAAVLAVGAIAAPAAGTATPLAGTVARLSASLDRAGADALFRLVNDTRARHGAAPLVRDPALDRIAAEHSLRMARSGVLAHNDALFTRASHLALGIRTFAENVGYDWSVAGAHDGFLTSPHHRENLLGPAYRLAGFAVVRDAKGALWVTEDFGTPRAGAAAVRAPAPAAAAPARAASPKPSARRTTVPAKPASPRPAPAVKASAPPPPAPPVRAAVREEPQRREAAPAMLPVAGPAADPGRGRSPSPLLALLALPVLLLARRSARR